MSTEKLSDAVCDQAQGPPADGKRAYLIHYDSDVKGFGLRVTRAGAKSFVLNYRSAGIERRYTIGSFNTWGTEKARKEAQRLKQEIDQGEDPQDKKRARREAPTVNELIDLWRGDHALGKRASSRLEDEGLIKQWIRPQLGTRKVADIRRTDIQALHRKITASGTRYRANRVLSLVSTLLQLAVDDEWIDTNSARGIKRNKEQPRSRYLKDDDDNDELGRLQAALDKDQDRQKADAIRLLLLTGARKGEVLGATWPEFNLATGKWVKPVERVKANREHDIPLSGPAIELLTAIKERQQRAVEEWNATRRPGQAKHAAPALVFPGQRGKGPLRVDHAWWAALCRTAGLEGLRIHDLRHSYASLLVNAGLSLPVIGSLLGHTQPGTTARYAHLSDKVTRAATEKVGEAIAKAGAAGGGKVVPLPRK